MKTDNLFPQEETASMDFGLPLTMKYQPQTVNEFCGLNKPKQILASLLKHPRPCSLILCGPPGTGKTTIALAFAKQLGAGLIHVASQSLTVDEVERTWDRVQYYPSSKNPYWVILVDEAETMSYAAQRALLSHLDSTAAMRPTFGGGQEPCKPLPIIWLFTCNGEGEKGIELPDTFEPRFRSRSLVIPFESLNGELAPWLRTVWDAETDTDPDLIPDFDAIAKQSHGQVRDALQALELAIMEQVNREPEILAEPPKELGEMSIEELWATN